MRTRVGEAPTRTSDSPKVMAATAATDCSDNDPLCVPAMAARFVCSDAATHNPDGLHQAVAIFCLSPAVPLQSKVYYFALASCLVGMQLFAILGVLHSIPDVNYDDIVEQVNGVWSHEGWPMHVFLCLMAACAIQQDMHDARLVELLLSIRLTHADAAISSSARFWWLPLTVIQTLRLDALLPMVAATAPLLAVAVGMDAFNSALNLLAVLFVLDADDLVYSCVFARHQRCMIEAIEFTVQADDQRRLNSVIFYALVAMALSMLCSIIIIVVIGSNPEISNSYNVMVMGFAEDFFFPTATSFFTVLFFSGTTVLYFAALSSVYTIQIARSRRSWPAAKLCIVRLGLIVVAVACYNQLLGVASIGNAAGAGPPASAEPPANGNATGNITSPQTNSSGLMSVPSGFGSGPPT